MALGAVVAMVVAVVLWPRGTRAQLRSETAEALASAGRYATGSLHGALGAPPAGPLADERHAAVGAQRRAEEALVEAQAEAAHSHLDRTWARLLTGSRALRQAGDAVRVIPTSPAVTDGDGARGQLGPSVDALAVTLAGILPDEAKPDGAPALDATRPDIRAGARDGGPGDDGIGGEERRWLLGAVAAATTPTAAEALIPTVWVVAWVRTIEGLAHELTAAATALERPQG